MDTKKQKQIFIVLGVLAIIILGAGIYFFGFIQGTKRENFTSKESSLVEIASTTTPIPPCSLLTAPDGSLVPVCDARVGNIVPSPSSLSLTDQSMPLSAGTGTTTLKKQTPFNDILIAESGSPYASLRNARYTTWPYPGEIPLKEIYLVLPETYEPIFPGYSNNQFIELVDGTKHILIYLRHKNSTNVGADARIFIQSPSPTNEPNHPLMRFDSTDSWTGFSIVSNGQEVSVEVSFSESLRFIPGAHTELLESVKKMEIIW